MMTAELREHVAKDKDEDGNVILIEICELVVRATDARERARLEMFKARATRHQLCSCAVDEGEAVIWLQRPL